MNAREILLDAERVELLDTLERTILSHLNIVELELENCFVLAPTEIPQAIRNVQPAVRRVVQRWHSAHPLPCLPPT